MLNILVGLKNKLEIEKNEEEITKRLKIHNNITFSYLRINKTSKNYNDVV